MYQLTDCPATGVPVVALRTVAVKVALPVQSALLSPLMLTEYGFWPMYALVGLTSAKAIKPSSSVMGSLLFGVGNFAPPARSAACQMQDRGNRSSHDAQIQPDRPAVD